jgi:hypothetical protein
VETSVTVESGKESMVEGSMVGESMVDKDSMVEKTFVAGSMVEHLDLDRDLDFSTRMKHFCVSLDPWGYFFSSGVGVCFDFR